MIRRSLLLFAIVLLFGSCRRTESNVAQQGEGNRRPIKFLSQADVKQVVEEQFKETYDGNFNTQDSCLFRAYVNHEFTSNEIVPFNYFENCLIFHGTEQTISFHFLVLGSSDSTDLNFYGLYDIYALYFSESSNNGKIIPFRNGALSRILNRFIKLKTVPSDYQVFKVFNTFIMNMYSRNEHYAFNVNDPVFDKMLRNGEFRSRYRNSRNAESFDKLFGNLDHEIVSIFEIDYIGAIVFKCIFNADGSFAVEEFVLPREDRVWVSRNDGLPDYADSCLGK